MNDFNKFGRTWQVLMSAEPSYRARPDSIGEIYVRSAQGEMIPLKSLATVQLLRRARTRSIASTTCRR